MEQITPLLGWAILAFLVVSDRVRWRNRPDVSYGTALNFFYAMFWYFTEMKEGFRDDKAERYRHDLVAKAARELDQEFRASGARWWH